MVTVLTVAAPYAATAHAMSPADSAAYYDSDDALTPATDPMDESDTDTAHFDGVPASYDDSPLSTEGQSGAGDYARPESPLPPNGTIDNGEDDGDDTDDPDMNDPNSGNGDPCDPNRPLPKSPIDPNAKIGNCGGEGENEASNSVDVPDPGDPGLNEDPGDGNLPQCDPTRPLMDPDPLEPNARIDVCK